tara:strand:+ start:1203 stop:1553 length:351 start_codon:yes stop_codon:yes gene_type:complete
MTYPTAEPLRSNRSNKPVKNQLVITGFNHYGDKNSSMATTQYKLFQSYDSKIAIIESDPMGEDILYLDPKYYNYSQTTSKYLQIFLLENYIPISTREYTNVKELIKNNIAIFKDLN